MPKLRAKLVPMEARPVAEIPVGDLWQYEPKWDGFRCLTYRDGSAVKLLSKSGQSLGRYFPELVESVKELQSRRFMLDGEIVIAVRGRLSFDDLLMRIHPAESRVRKLSAEFPATLIIFDLLADAAESLIDLPLRERRKRLDSFAARFLRKTADIRLSPATQNLAVARRWFKQAGGALDGIIAKRVDLPYRAGLRDGMQKIKHRKTVDCVVGGFRYAQSGRAIGSLLLGLFNSNGLLDHVGFTSSFRADERKKLAGWIRPLRGGVGFTGKAPGGPSRWSKRDQTEWTPLAPKLVVEVEYDHFTGGRFRHGTRFLRLRPDKLPRDCTLDQIKGTRGNAIRLLESQKIEVV